MKYFVPDEQHWSQYDGDGHVHLHDVTVAELLDDQIPVYFMTCRRRPGLMMNISVPRSHYVPTNEQLGAQSSCWKTLFQLLLLGDMPIENTSIYFIIYFWRQQMDSERNQPHRLWTSFNEIMGRGSATPTEIDASTLHQLFL